MQDCGHPGLPAGVLGHVHHHCASVVGVSLDQSLETAALRNNSLSILLLITVISFASMPCSRGTSRVPNSCGGWAMSPC